MARHFGASVKPVALGGSPECSRQVRLFRPQRRGRRHLRTLRPAPRRRGPPRRLSADRPKAARLADGAEMRGGDPVQSHAQEPVSPKSLSEKGLWEG